MKLPKFLRRKRKQTNQESDKLPEAETAALADFEPPDPSKPKPSSGKKSVNGRGGGIHPSANERKATEPVHGAAIQAEVPSQRVQLSNPNSFEPEPPQKISAIKLHTRQSLPPDGPAKSNIESTKSAGGFPNGHQIQSPGFTKSEEKHPPPVVESSSTHDELDSNAQQSRPGVAHQSSSGLLQAELRSTIKSSGKTHPEHDDNKNMVRVVRRGSLNESDASHREMDETDTPDILKSYEAIPVMEQTKLPRGGVSVDTQAVGRVQFGIPPETIKDSMRLGIQVPQVYIVPVERFCREMGPALGVNLAEFEFPAYFNFFVHKKRCTLVVDSDEAEENIRRVFSETLLGPAQFRREEDPVVYEEEDFSPDFDREAIPNFPKELHYFRIMPDGSELVLETLLDFCHFELPGEGGVHENLGVPPPLPTKDVDSEPTAEEVENAAIKAANALAPVESEEEEEDFEEEVEAVEAVPKDEGEVENRDVKSPWTYSHARWVGDVATVWPTNATPEQIEARNVPRVEVFKMPGGTEYIIHDVDERNYIVGKARVSGHVKVSEAMSVDGFGGRSFLDDLKLIMPEMKADLEDDSESSDAVDNLFQLPPSFHPPSFGVTVLGNSHGFDKSGSVSGYVLWVNGRGVMIDPPPYSSATLEREGIRPRTIVAIVLTHCHADHDAGAFQKVLTGSPVVVITTPTIYKSFIRKYAALSALSPALLRHSHRYKPAIIGQPLRFQGATFHFMYTLHTIPCVGFRVEWRGRSLVFTADHFNSPPAIEKLEATGVMTKARADDLRNLPLQETDLLLHEAGAPPIHTPLDVLLQLPDRVKKRLYVVHTSALPEDCELKSAPTGTPDTLRLDQPTTRFGSTAPSNRTSRPGPRRDVSRDSILEDELFEDSHWGSADNEYSSFLDEPHDRGSEHQLMSHSFAHLEMQNPMKRGFRNSQIGENVVPPVSLRPASSTDAWFILNLLSAVPFLSSLSYTSTMEVLETARVDAYCMNDVVVPAARRSQLLCVVWEGTCVEREKSLNIGKPNQSLVAIQETKDRGKTGAVWHAGDWTGPVALQPEKRLSGESDLSSTHDIVAMSKEGAKVITVEFASLHMILKSGSALYRKYLERRVQQHQRNATMDDMSNRDSFTTTEKLLDDALRNLNVLELLDCNSAMRKLSAVQKRHLECLAEGPLSYGPGDRLWQAGAPVDKAFIIVSGTASFVQKRRNAGSGLGHARRSSGKNSRRFDGGGNFQGKKGNIGDDMVNDIHTAVRELAHAVHHDDSSMSSIDADPTHGQSPKPTQMPLEQVFRQRAPGADGMSTSLSDSHDYDMLKVGLQKRADLLNAGSTHSANASQANSEDIGEESSDGGTEGLEYSFGELDVSNSTPTQDRRSLLAKRRSSRARFAQKVLGRLYSRRAFTGGLVFSRGHFLGDVSKMVAGLLAGDVELQMEDDSSFPAYGFGDTREGGIREGSGSINEAMAETNLTNMVIHEQDNNLQILHSSTLKAGNDGCVVLVFHKSALIPFLDEFPGLLLSLLGTQVVV